MRGRRENAFEGDRFESLHSLSIGHPAPPDPPQPDIKTRTLASEARRAKKTVFEEGDDVLRNIEGTRRSLELRSERGYRKGQDRRGAGCTRRAVRS